MDELQDSQFRLSSAWLCLEHVASEMEREGVESKQVQVITMKFMDIISFSDRLLHHPYISTSTDKLRLIPLLA